MLYLKGTSVCKASTLLCGLYELNQSADLVLGRSIETAIPISLGELPSKIRLNCKVSLPASQDTRAREISSFSLTVGKGYLPPQFWTPDL